MGLFSGTLRQCGTIEVPDGRERGTETSAAGVTMSKRARKRRDRKKKGANHGKRPTC
jgi:hypothetical protein